MYIFRFDILNFNLILYFVIEEKALKKINITTAANMGSTISPNSVTHMKY